MGAGCLFWGTRVVNPWKLQLTLLEELHTDHPSIVRMKVVTWWPGPGLDYSN